MTPQALQEQLGAFRFRFQDERELQDGLAAVFVRLGLPYQREAHLPGKAGIIDFLVGEGEQLVGLEVKVGGSLSSVTAQVHRYAQVERIAGLLLVTARARHAAMPDTLNGKPFVVHYLVGSSL